MLRICHSPKKNSTSSSELIVSMQKVALPSVLLCIFVFCKYRWNYVDVYIFNFVFFFVFSAPIRNGGPSVSVNRNQKILGVSLLRLDSFISSKSFSFGSNNSPISITSILKGSEVAFPRALEATTVR